MKVIIAGGRYGILSKGAKNSILRLVEQGKLTELVCGMAKGIDQEAYMLLKDKVPIKEFPADWDTYGKGAGPIRNEQMAVYADAVILFRGNRGTDNMCINAERYGLEIIFDEGSIN